MIRKYLSETEFESLNGVYNSNVDYVVVDEENNPKKVVFVTNNINGTIATFDIEDEFPTPTGAISITENGENIDVKEYATANVNVPNPSTGTLNITSNDTYDVTNYASVVVNVQPEQPEQQEQPE